MKKMFKLLKPDIRKGYMTDDKNGEVKGQKEKFRYLHISPDYDESLLESDIRSGAVQFKGCLEYARSGEINDFTIIRCDTEEEGLKAVTYMEACRGFEDPMDEDVKPEEEGYSELDYDNNILIVDMKEITAYENRNEGPVFGESFSMQSNREIAKKDPIWLDYEGKVIIVDTYMDNGDNEIVLLNHDYPAFGPMGDTERYHWHEYFERFTEYGEGIYYLLVRDVGLSGLFESDKETVDEEDDGIFPGVFNPFANRIKDYSLCKLLLRYTADMLKLEAKQEEKEKYYIELFKGFLANYSYNTEKGFPMKKTVRNICFIDKSPAEAMDLVLRYIKHKYKDVKTISGKMFTEAGVLSDVIRESGDKRKKENLSVDDLVGMEDVKQQFENIIRTIKFSRERKDKGLPVLDYRNIFMLIGAPGTAKTTMANILGRRMKEERLLGGTKFGSFSGAQLKGAYVGQTAPKVHDIFEKHDIILIDEAYSLTASDNGGMDIYSQEALAQLAIELENHGKDRLIFFAGYGGSDISGKNNKMKDFLDANPGIKSRINGTIVFPSYTSSQMFNIVKCIANRFGFTFDDNALDSLTDYFDARVKDENFGNGREARSFVDNCQMTVAERVMKLPEGKRTKKMMQRITKEDVEETISRLKKSYENQTGNKIRYGFLS
ncbi:MAG: AAA family ATPase [Lachnospiraceae bacterium]|nr:AAA family ATPase [Lachnospiraceae bacterium]